MAGFTKEPASLRYVSITFSFDLLNIFCIENHVFLPFLIKFLMQTYFFPDGTNVKSKKVYWFVTSISFPLE